MRFLSLVKNQNQRPKSYKMKKVCLNFKPIKMKRKKMSLN